MDYRSNGARVIVSNPSRGTCAFGPADLALVGKVVEMSQTPLGERVPSAQLWVLRCRPSYSASQTPLGERVPSALVGRVAEIWGIQESQTPLGERVPSAEERRLVGVLSWWSCLKPLSGNVCLRPLCVACAESWARDVSNPSRGTCAFGRMSKGNPILAWDTSQTPLGERVPSAAGRGP